MSLALKRFENPLRPAYEAIAATCWTLSAVAMCVVLAITSLPRFAFVAMTSMSVAFAVWRWHGAVRRWDFKLNLLGKPFAFMRMQMLRRLMKAAPDDVWLGFGFDWTPIHTQRVEEIRKHEPKDALPPKWFIKMRGADKSVKQVIGKPWIHGVGDKEEQIFSPLATLPGNTLVFGTTRAGKTRLAEILISQAILRGDKSIFIIDPKGDKEMREIAKKACALAGHPERFLSFHPAFPSESVRLDPLKNWNNLTEVASRIAALMPSEAGDNFAAMAWKAVQVVTEGLIYVDQMPNLMRLRRFIEGGPEKLMEEILRTFLVRNVPRWETLVAPLVSRAREGKIPVKVSGSAELLAYIYYYKTEVPETLRDQAVDGLMALVEHNREHLGKILASLVPVLVMLTAGELGKMLSPDPADMNDDRPIFDTKKVINGGYVFYLGTDSLSNATVGSALASVVLADLAAVAGDRYNYEEAPESDRISVFVDESAEAVNVPLVQLLNKGGGCGFITTLFAQTLPDFVAKMGNEARARQILGNCNNLIALRTIERQTQEYIVERFDETRIQSIQRGITTSSAADDFGIDHSGALQHRLAEEKVDMFPPALLGMLPNLHFVACMAGGRIIKCRIPKLLY